MIQAEITSSPQGLGRIIGGHVQEETWSSSCWRGLLILKSVFHLQQQKDRPLSYPKSPYYKSAPVHITSTVWRKWSGHYASGWHLRKIHQFTGFKYINWVRKVSDKAGVFCHTLNKNYLGVFLFTTKWSLASEVSRLSKNRLLYQRQIRAAGTLSFISLYSTLIR